MESITPESGSENYNRFDFVINMWQKILCRHIALLVVVNWICEAVLMLIFNEVVIRLRLLPPLDMIVWIPIIISYLGHCYILSSRFSRVKIAVMSLILSWMGTIISIVFIAATYGITSW
jgi:hypothetical protein